MKSQRRTSAACLRPRQGSALLTVLIVTAMLSLAAYTYSELMISEYDAAQRTARMIEARQMVDSGIEYAAIVIGLRGTDSEEGLYHNPERFHRVLVAEGNGDRPSSYFSIVSPVENDSTFQSVRFGLRNESAKLNLNALANSALTEDEQRLFLMNLPGMTDAIADSIFDWIDSDDVARAYGAETEYYQSFPVPYSCKNGPLETLDELLSVDGVTFELLFGEDTNRNGLLDPQEDDGSSSAPFDNEDGVLDLGWSEYLTVFARESNLKTDGSTKISLNSNELTGLYDDITEAIDEEAAQFIVAYRIYGPSNRDDAETPGGLSGDATNDMTLEEEELMRAITREITDGLMGNSGGNVTRGGLDLKDGGAYRINSIYDLIDAEVEATVEGSATTLTSPWTSDPAGLQEDLPLLMDVLGITSDSWVEGRIDLNQARYETLMGIPGMTEEIAQAILDSKAIDENGEPLLDVLETRQTNGWLLIDGLVDLPTMRQLDPYLTTQGDVFQAQVIGYFENSGVSCRVSVFIDGSQKPARVLSFSDYSELGVGYPLREWQEEGGSR